MDNGAILQRTPAATQAAQYTPNHMVVNGVSAGTSHTVKIRAVDFADLDSGWSSPITITTPSTPPTPAGGQPWPDVNGDGLPDEIEMSSDTSALIRSFEGERSSRTMSFSSSSTDWYFVPYDTGPVFADRGAAMLYGWWIPVIDFDTESDVIIDTVSPVFQFQSQAGYNYNLARKVIGTDGTIRFITLFPPTGFDHDGAPFGTDEWPITDAWPLDAYYAFPTYLVRYGLPAGGIQINLGVLGKLQIDTGGGVRGKLTLPSGIVVSATPNGDAAINIPSSVIPGGVTINSSGGILSGGIMLPGGYILTAGSGGNGTLTIPNVGTISIGPGGVGLVTQTGLGVTVDGNGHIGLSVPQGSGQKLDSVLDALGKILGTGPVGPNAQIGVRPVGSTAPIIWEDPANVDLSNRNPGDYDVAVRSQDSQRTTPLPPQIWIRLSVQYPAPNLAIVYPATGEISASRAQSEGGLIAIRRDAGTPVTKLRLHPTQPVANGQYKLSWTGNKIQIWQDSARTQLVVSGQTAFPIDVDTDVYVEGVSKSSVLKDTLVTLVLNNATTNLSQSALSLTVVDAEFDIQIKMWIREQWIQVPWHLWDNFYLNKIAGGDDRDNSTSPGAAYRVTQLATVIPYQDLDADGIKNPLPPSVFQRNLPGISSLYDKITSVPNPSAPYSATNRFIVGAYPTHTQVPDVSRMHIDAVPRTTSNSIKTRFSGAANDPLITFSSDIDWDITVGLNCANILNPTFEITGGREAYPAIEIDIGDSVGRRSPQPYFWLHPLPSSVLDLVGGTLTPLPFPTSGNVR